MNKTINVSIYDLSRDEERTKLLRMADTKEHITLTINPYAGPLGDKERLTILHAVADMVGADPTRLAKEPVSIELLPIDPCLATYSNYQFVERQRIADFLQHMGEPGLTPSYEETKPSTDVLPRLKT